MHEERSSVAKAFDLVDAFGAEAMTGSMLTQLARRAKLSPSTALRLLTMLTEQGVVERVGKTYRLMPDRAPMPPRQLTVRQSTIRDRLAPYLADLYVATRLTIGLAVLDGERVIYLNSLLGPGGESSVERLVGMPLPAYATAAGKILLAADRELAAAVLKSRKVAWTEQTITENPVLRRELREARKTGYAIDRGELLPDIGGIAVPITLPHLGTIAAFSARTPIGMQNYRGVLLFMKRAAELAAMTLQRSRLHPYYPLDITVDEDVDWDRELLPHHPQDLGDADPNPTGPIAESTAV